MLRLTVSSLTTMTAKGFLGSPVVKCGSLCPSGPPLFVLSPCACFQAQAI